MESAARAPRARIPACGWLFPMLLALSAALPSLARAQSASWMPREAGFEVSAGALPAWAMSAAVRSHRDLGAAGAALRFFWPARSGGWRLRAGFWEITLQDGNYLARGYGYDEVQYVWFDPIRLVHLQADREFSVARTGVWRWFAAAGAGAGWLSGSLRMQNASGCTAANWRRPDTDPAWGGCYHDPEPYGTEPYRLPPAGGFLHMAIGTRRAVVRNCGLALEAGLFLPGFAAFSLAFDCRFH